MYRLNSYIGMAENDYLYAKAGMEVCRQLGNYNSVASGCAQAAEKYLKALAEICLVDDEDGVTVLKTQNLRTLVNRIKEHFPKIALDSRDCKWLGDFYFDARYPGDNFVLVNEEDAGECLRITGELREIVIGALEQLNDVRQKKGSLTKEDTDMEFLRGMRRL